MNLIESLRVRLKPQSSPEYQKVLSALEIWLDNHPTPGENVRLDITTGKTWSPLSYVDEVRRGSREGRRIVENFLGLASIDPEGLNGVIQSLTKTPPTPNDPLEAPKYQFKINF